MPTPQIRLLAGSAELRRHTGAWNDLWLRSSAALPTKRAQGVDQWCQAFAQPENLEAIIVQEDDRLIAGLPLVVSRKHGLTTHAELPSNCWSVAGDLMVDAECDLTTTCDQIVRFLATRPYRVLKLDLIEFQSERWSAFQSALQSQGHAYRTSSSYSVGVVDILHDWEAYQKSWSGNHRQAVRKSRRQLEAKGELHVERIQVDTSELESRLQECFDVEDRGWKGQEGTSILKSAGMDSFYQTEAVTMARSGMLDLWTLRFDGRLIAFEYCHLAKGVCFSHKISFDPEFQKYGPGRLLRCMQLEQLHAEPGMRKLDTLGILCSSKAKWSTSAYQLGRLVASSRPGFSSALLRTAFAARPLIKRALNKSESTVETPKLGATKVFDLAKPQATLTPIPSGSGFQPVTLGSGDTMSQPLS
ncbi:MAG: GNAT family N-acetyltransferase [Planctomycetota bacterium]